MSFMSCRVMSLERSTDVCLYQMSIIFLFTACNCSQQDLKDVSVKPGDTSTEVEWQVPVLTCVNFPSPTLSQSLCVGQHSVAYKYNIANKFNVTCRVNIKVTGKSFAN